MTTAAERLERTWAEPHGVAAWVTTVDHKRIGVRYLITAAIFFLLAGADALVMRTQLAVAEARLLTPELYNQLFTLHGVTMIFWFVTPMLFGFGNYFIPLMIGARDMAFPRLNALSYWVFLFSGLFMYSSVVVGAMPDAGWFNYVPLSQEEFSAGWGIDYYTLGLLFLAISTTAGAANFIVTIMRMRAPGMSLNRMPLFCWAILATSCAVIFAIPALTAANLMLTLERRFEFTFFTPATGGDPLLWQHLFWIFGHPDVYIIFLPAVGLVSTILPAFARQRLVAYTWVATATVLTGVLGFGVWVHHMFATGLPQITIGFYSAASLLIAIPSGVQVFAWIATLRRGRPVVRSPLLYLLGFVVTFVIGGITGVMVGVAPFDQQITDSYFVVAHFHYVLFGGAVFPILAAVHFWTPKITGRMLSDRLGAVSFWLVFVGFNTTFFPMHVMGLLGMPRRVYTYPSDGGWEIYNLVASAGSAVLAAGLAIVAVNVGRSLRRGPPAGDDPWRADTLEWRTSSPPPPYNFERIPRVRSAHPAWDPPDDDSERPVLAEGHLTPGTTAVEAAPNRVMHMPSRSWCPFALALSLAMMFTGLLVAVHWLAVAGAVAAIAVLAAWNRVAPDPHAETTVAGHWGMWILIATEAALFACLIVSYFYLRFRDSEEWPPGSLEEPKLLRPVVMTVLLASSSVPIHLADRAVRRGGRRMLIGGLGAGAVLGIAFLGIQITEYLSKAKEFGPGDHAYGSLFYAITGLHGAHVVAGLALVVWSLGHAAAGAFGPRRHGTVHNTALYWHFVHAVWLVVFLSLYLSEQG